MWTWSLQGKIGHVEHQTPDFLAGRGWHAQNLFNSMITKGKGWLVWTGTMQRATRQLQQARRCTWRPRLQGAQARPPSLPQRQCRYATPPAIMSSVHACIVCVRARVCGGGGVEGRGKGGFTGCKRMVFFSITRQKYRIQIQPSLPQSQRRYVTLASVQSVLVSPASLPPCIAAGP